MRLSVFVLGTAAMTAQAAFLREVLATFRGGELTIGAALLFWLLWTAAGSGIAGRFVSRTSSPHTRFHKLLPWYGVMGYTGVAVIASIPWLARLTPGELVSYDIQLIALGVAFLPFNVLGGVLFSLGVKAFEQESDSSAGRVFALEALGAAAAGAVISIFLVHIFSNSVIALLCPLATFTGVIAWSLRHRNSNGIVRLVFPIILLSCVILVNSHAYNYMYTGQELLNHKDTRYGRLRVTRHGETVTFYSDASTLFSAPDRETSEYTAHIPMLAAPHHKSVLVLGGSPGGVIDEILKYSSVETVTCVELDPHIFKLAEEYLDTSWTHDSRVTTVIADGRAFMERTDAVFDVIIMTMPSPLSGVTNRYYTKEFFKLVSNRLSCEGVFGFPLSGAENYIPDDLAFFLASIRATLASAFPSVTVLPGTTCRYLASNTAGTVDSLGWETLTGRRASIGIETDYVRDYYLEYVLSPERMDVLRETLDTVTAPFINSDTLPAGYFSRTLVQGKLDGSKSLKLIESVADPKLLFYLIIFGLGALTCFAAVPGKGALRRSITATVISVGLTEISLEILAIMAYQSMFGFLYGRIALLTGSYMAGLAAGAWAGTRRVEQNRAGIKQLAIIQSLIAIIPLLWIVLFRIDGMYTGHIPFIEPAFFLLTACAGVAGGIQFPIADNLYRDSLPEREIKGGVIYGVDLAGSSIGALVTASLLIPLLGMTTVLGFLSILSILTAGALWLRAG